MVWTNWVPAFTLSALVLAILGFALKISYKALVEKGVQSQFDHKLEEFKAELRRDDEIFKTNFKRQDEQLATLRAGVLSNISNRSQALDKRRLEAAERLWNAVIDENQYRLAVRMVSVVKTEVALDVASQQNEDGQKIRLFADNIWKVSGLENLQKKELQIDKERPFVSPTTWSLFSVYRQIFAYALAEILALKSGLGRKMIKAPDDIIASIKIALPHYSELLDQHGMSGAYEILDDLQEKILAELIVGLEGFTSDENTIERTMKIIKGTQQAADALAPTIEIPNIRGIKR